MIKKDYKQLEDHKDSKSVILGSINFEDSILTERQVQAKSRFSPKGVGECIIEIFANEGQIPHFHIHNKDNSFSTCIRLYENLYFSHGGKYIDTFNSSQCRKLNEYLKQPCPQFFNKITIWEALVGYWESDCSSDYPHKVKVQPHYEDMNSFRDVI